MSPNFVFFGFFFGNVSGFRLFAFGFFGFFWFYNGSGYFFMEIVGFTMVLARSLLEIIRFM